MSVLTLTTKFEMLGGRYSILSDEAHLQMWVMERSWAYNKRNVSCIPRDEYRVEKHNGTKYKGTYALIGDGVSHEEQDGVPRFACVFHRSVFPSGLQGCLCPCESIDSSGHSNKAQEALQRLIEYFDKQTTDIKILCQ